MNRNAIVHKFESTLNFLRNQRVVIISLVGAAATIFPLLGARLSNNSYLDSLGRTAVAHQPSAVPRDSQWAAEFNQKYQRGVSCDSFSYMVPKNQPLQRLVPLDIRQEEANHALVKDVLEAAQKMGLAPETSENSLNNSLEKQGNKTQRYGVSVGIGPALSANLNVHNTPVGLPAGSFNLLQQHIQGLDSVGAKIGQDLHALKQQLTEMKKTFIDSINNEIAFNRSQLFKYRHPCELEFTDFDQNDHQEMLSGLTGRQFRKSVEGGIIEKKLTPDDLDYFLRNYGFESVHIARVRDGAQQLLRMEQSLNQAIKNQQSLAETEAALTQTQKLESTPGSKCYFKLRALPAVLQVYVPLPATQAQGSICLDLKSKELCVGVGKSVFISPNDSNFGLLVGADVHAKCIAQPNVGFGGVGAKLFAGLGVNL